MRFIYVGRLDVLKGIKMMLEGWRILGKDAPVLDICGDGPLSKWCDEYIKDKGLKTVILHGRVPNDEAKRLIASSEALIMPTLLYEGFPMTIVEAYSTGTAVIGSDIGNTACLIQNGITGYTFSVGDADALAKAIREFKSLPKEQILRIYREKYSKEKNIEILERIYCSCIAMGS